MKKFRIFFTALILTLSIAAVPSEVINDSVLSAFAEAADEISHEQQENDEDKDDDSPSKAVSALIIIGLFTVTFAVSGVFTYKLRKNNTSPNQDKSKQE